MRFSSIALFAGSWACAQAQSHSKEKDSGKKTTEFNSIEVPPLLELDPANWESEAQKTKWLFVKHFSPYCPHCIDYAPTFQTLYEYYYTSKLDAKDAKDADFSDYYGFRFGSLNCVAYYDLCMDHNVQSYPTTILYKDGKMVESLRGVKNMTVLSGVVEDALEKTKPGSRPATIELPEPGDKEFPKPGSAKEKESTGADKKSDKSSKAVEKAAAGASKGGKSSEGDKMAGANSGKTEKATTGSTSKDSEKSVKKGESEKSAKKDKSDKPVGSKTSGGKWKAPTAGELYNQRNPQKSTTTPNLDGALVSLSAASYKKMVSQTKDPWFIKFYAPWCPHCQALAPTWEQLAKNMKGKLNTGEVNCDQEKQLCKEVHARAYPTLLFIKGNERVEYNGLRGLGDFVEYSNSAIQLAGGVPDVDAKSLKALEEKEDVVMVYFYDHATTTEDFAALDKLPLNLIGRAKLVKTSDPKLYDRFKITTFPRLLVSREGRPTYYTPITPDEMRDVSAVLAWMKSVWLPLVPELTASNARQIMDKRIVVLAVLNRENTSGFQTAIRELKSAAGEWMDRQIQEFQLERKKLRDAKQMRIEEAADRNDERALRAAKTIKIDMNKSDRKEVGFAWVDGAFWQRWIRTTYGVDVKDGERIIINDEDQRQYWDTSATGNYIMVSRTSIMETLDKVVYSPHVIKSKYTISAFSKFFFDLRRCFVEHPYLSIASAFGIIFAFFSWLRTRSRRARGTFRLDDSMGIRDLKEGLLGQNGNAKAD